jgi:hypothetical protein
MIYFYGIGKHLFFELITFNFICSFIHYHCVYFIYVIKLIKHIKLNPVNNSSLGFIFAFLKLLRHFSINYLCWKKLSPACRGGRLFSFQL